MIKHLMLKSMLILVVWGMSFAAHAMADVRTVIDIRTVHPATAWESIEKQATVQLLFRPDQLRQFHTRGGKDAYEPRDAVRILLKGTPVDLRSDPTSAMVIGPAASNMNSTGYFTTLSDYGQTDEEETGSGPALVAQAPVRQTSRSASLESQSQVKQDEKRPAELEEVLVTAQKKTENLMDVPVPVTAIKAETLAGNNLVRVQDYYSQVPGLSLVGFSQDSQMLSIRGIATTPTGNPTVGVTVDDVPFGASTGNGDGLMVPEFDPGDLERVEVLRGPQGTLYGTASMGGVMKFVTVDPSTDGFSARAEAGTDTIHNGAGLGYTIRASVNVPLNSTLAVRASVFDREDSGYIDNPILHLTGVNVDHGSGGRLSLLWRPNEAISLKLSALYQQTKGSGQNDVNFTLQPVFANQPPLGDLQQDHVAGVGPYDRNLQVYSAVLKATFGGVDLTSVTGFNKTYDLATLDTSQLVGPLAQAVFGVGGVVTYQTVHNHDFSQELRLTGTAGRSFDWLVGAFYTSQYTNYLSMAEAAEPTGAIVSADFYNNVFPTTYDEYAGFADLTWHPNDSFSVQFGGRETHYTENTQITNFGVACPVIYQVPSPCPQPNERASSTPFTYLITPQYKIGSDLLAYARFSSGYRAGGGNLKSAGVPDEYQPDKTYNYELGLKGSFLEHRLSLDASVYYIDWKNIQLGLTNLQTATLYTGNASSAKSEGLDLSVESRPMGGLKVGGWIAFNKAVLTSSFPASALAAGTYGVEGNRLPWSPRFSANLSFEDDFPLTSQLTGSARVLLSYIGDRQDVFTSSPTRQDLPAYARTDVQLGINYNSWKASVYVNNLADRRGLISGGLGNPVPTSLFIIQPRQIGLTLIWQR